MATRGKRRTRPKNPPGWTNLTGLGSGHQQQRKLAISLLRSGKDLCPRCRRPMYSWQKLDLGDAKARVLGGGQVKRLEHASCNRSHGARLGNQLRKRGIRRKRPPGFRSR